MALQQRPEMDLLTIIRLLTRLGSHGAAGLGGWGQMPWLQNQVAPALGGLSGLAQLGQAFQAPNPWSGALRGASGFLGAYRGLQGLTGQTLPNIPYAGQLGALLGLGNIGMNLFNSSQPPAARAFGALGGVTSLISNMPASLAAQIPGLSSLQALGQTTIPGTAIGGAGGIPYAQAVMALANAGIAGAGAPNAGAGTMAALGALGDVGLGVLTGPLGMFFGGGQAISGAFNALAKSFGLGPVPTHRQREAISTGHTMGVAKTAFDELNLVSSDRELEDVLKTYARGIKGVPITMNSRGQYNVHAGVNPGYLTPANQAINSAVQQTRMLLQQAAAGDPNAKAAVEARAKARKDLSGVIHSALYDNTFSYDSGEGGVIQQPNWTGVGYTEDMERNFLNQLGGYGGVAGIPQWIQNMKGGGQPTSTDPRMESILNVLNPRRNLNRSTWREPEPVSAHVPVTNWSSA